MASDKMQKNVIEEEEEEEEEEENEVGREDNGNDGSISDNEDEGDDLDSTSPAPSEQEQENDKKHKRDNQSNNEHPDRHRKLTEYQRKLRNAREKRRSGKICDQFDHIRDTMVKAGVIVPKGTKGTILAAAKEYIGMLQEQQKRVAL